MADRATASKSGLLLDLAMEGMQIGETDRPTAPSIFEEADLTSET